MPHRSMKVFVNHGCRPAWSSSDGRLLTLTALSPQVFRYLSRSMLAPETIAAARPLLDVLSAKAPAKATAPAPSTKSVASNKSARIAWAIWRSVTESHRCTTDRDTSTVTDLVSKPPTKPCAMEVL